MLDDAHHDDLIARVRDRAADPERRVDERPSQLWSEMTSASLGGLASEVTRRYWASMTPERRAEHGLPERGWGRALFGDAWGDDPRDGSGDA